MILRQALKIRETGGVADDALGLKRLVTPASPVESQAKERCVLRYRAGWPMATACFHLRSQRVRNAPGQLLRPRLGRLELLEKLLPYPATGSPLRPFLQAQKGLPNVKLRMVSRLLAKDV